MMLVGLLGGLGIFAAIMVLVTISLRRVVPTNEVHIIQSGKKTISYGKDKPDGNIYYEWPSWVPFIGLSKTTLPTSNFDITLKNYPSYDQDRLPFLIDVMAFFRISDSNEAAQRVSNFDELHAQLTAIVQGAVRSILASVPLEKIMQDRSIFGEAFTKEVTEQLTNWGVTTVKNLELMDLCDAQGSQVIKNIMEKRKSFIEMESRTEVAANKQKAEVAEINGRREVELKNQEAKQMTGLRQVEVENQVQLAREKSEQVVKEEQRLTKEKEMAVVQTENVKVAEINKQVNVIKAEQDKAVELVKAEQNKQTLVIKSQADLESKKLSAEAEYTLVKRKADAAFEAKQRESDGIAVEGKVRAEVVTLNGKAEAEVIALNGRANAESAKALGLAQAEAAAAMELAPVSAQIKLATEIGNNKDYQAYLITVEQIKAGADVGKAQANALTNADIKVIATGGDAQSGLKSASELLTAKGGVALGTMLDAFKTTETGAALAKTFLGEKLN